MSRRALLAAAVLVLAGCSTGAGPDEPAAERSASSPGPDGADAPVATPVPRPEPELVVVAHATAAVLRLSRPEARRLTGPAGSPRRWQGRPVHRGETPRAAARALDRVERDPAALGVVPLEEVRPGVRAALVAGRDPVRTAPGAVHLTVVGDLMLVRGVPDPRQALAQVAPLLHRADLVVGNLESTLSTAGAPTQGSDSFGAGPELVGHLRRAGLDAVSLANNHTGDFGTEALRDTVRTLRGGPLAVFGAGVDLAEAGRPAYVERGGVRFALLGFNAIGETPRATAGSPGALSVRMPPRTGPLVRADLAHVTSLVRRAERRADVVVVLPHWGTQYTHEPEPVQREVSRALVAAGADLVVGGHPHWVQGIDVVEGPDAAVPVLHSLGNLVFDMDFMRQTMEGVVLETTFLGERLAALRLVPYVMDPGTFAPRPVGGADAARILGDVWAASTGPFAR
ncbi:CapA family protein [Nocardioides sp. zg-DK7169]|uniref:CapA family protein n=1 Tax=Nocardioides sp. zg-DK7169 TaxID=2736600 RepID=UPI0015528FE1|nr:CapA family protein [Nocardioides sp. zg-DK7169]NPC96962.1 CapA family protein [Nocardioides sp. zg-DK7169]